MFGKDDTLMWGGGKRVEPPQEITEQPVYNTEGEPQVISEDWAFAKPIDVSEILANIVAGASQVVMPDPENVPDHVLEVIRPLLITYEAGGSAEAKAIRNSIIRYGYGEALPEWFSESNYNGHVPKHDIAHLIYELFYYVIKHGEPERAPSQPKTKGRNKENER